MLSLLSVHDALHAGRFLDAGKEDRFFAVVVALHHVVPGETVTNEVRVVSGLNVGCLLVDAVVAADEDIMNNGHVRCLHCEVVGLWNEGSE